MTPAVSYELVSAYVRYTDAEHAHMADEWPEIANDALIVADTYDEALGYACERLIRVLLELRVEKPVRFIHHPHNEAGADPLDAFGSLGWRVVE